MAANVTNNGTVQPGSLTGVLEIDGTYMQTHTAQLYSYVVGAGGGCSNGELVVGGAPGTATIEGTLAVNYIACSGGPFTVLHSNGLSGVFSQVLGAGQVIYSGTDVVID